MKSLLLLALAAACLVSAALGASATETIPAHLRELLVAANFDEALKLAKPAARWPDQANGSEGLVQTNTPILLDWDLCIRRGSTNAATAPRPHISRYPWLEFVPTSNGLAAKVHLQVDSYPRTEWKLRLQQVDRFGAFVVVHHQQEQVIENSGTIERLPHFENRIATFPSNGGAKGALYQISIETVWTEQGNPVRWGEAMPLTLDLPTAARSRVFRAESLKLEQANHSVQATVKAEAVSWPKSHWRLTLELADPEGKRLGRGESSAENIGAIISRPSWSDALFQFPISGDLQALVTAQRWTLRIEALAQEPVK